jgi:hypothetical protein
MFEDIRNLAVGNMNAFSECVKDEFGRSIFRDVFEPILSELAGLIQINENMEKAISEINQINEELQAIGKHANEY